LARSGSLGGQPWLHLITRSAFPGLSRPRRCLTLSTSMLPWSRSEPCCTVSLPILRRCKGCWPGSRSSALVLSRCAACTSTLGQRWAAVRAVDGWRGGSDYSWPCRRRRRARPYPRAIGARDPSQVENQLHSPDRSSGRSHARQAQRGGPGTWAQAQGNSWPARAGH